MTIKQKLWNTFSRYIRMRDADESGYCECISCPKTLHWKEMDAGHFIPKSRGTYFYFNEDNVHAQCPACNRFGSMDTGYRYGEKLKMKIGVDMVKELESKSKSRPIMKLSKIQMNEIDKKYKLSIKQLQEFKNLD